MEALDKQCMAIFRIINNGLVFEEGCYVVEGPGEITYIGREGEEVSKRYPYVIEDHNGDRSPGGANGGGYGTSLGDPTDGDTGSVTINREVLYIKKVVSSSVVSITKVDC